MAFRLQFWEQRLQEGQFPGGINESLMRLLASQRPVFKLRGVQKWMLQASCEWLKGRSQTSVRLLDIPNRLTSLVASRCYVLPSFSVAPLHALWPGQEPA